MSTAYLNNYVAPAPAVVPSLTLETAANWQDYDFNFSGGPVYELSTDKIRMIPFNPILHARQWYESIKDLGDVLRYMPYRPAPWKSLEDCLAFIEMSIRSQPGALLFAIFATSGSISPAEKAFLGPQELPEGHPPLETMVGVMGALNVDRANLTGELGHIIVLPRAQRTHVTTHSVGLLMHYLLDHPYLSLYDPDTKCFQAPATPATTSSTPPPLTAPFVPASEGQLKRALGLRRCQWQANHLNLASAKAAKRMGFRHEGMIVDQRILVDSQIDLEEGRVGDGGRGWSRTSFMAALTWRDWENSRVDEEGNKVESVKEMVDRLVSRA